MPETGMLEWNSDEAHLLPLLSSGAAGKSSVGAPDRSSSDPAPVSRGGAYLVDHNGAPVRLRTRDGDHQSGQTDGP